MWVVFNALHHPHRPVRFFALVHHVINHPYRVLVTTPAAPNGHVTVVVAPARAGLVDG